MLSKGLFYHLTKTILLICFLGGYNNTYAQECVWLEVGGGATYENAQASAIDNNNNIIVGGRFLDSFSVGGHFIPQSTNGNFNTSFFIKYDSKGNILWTNAIKHTQTGLNSYCSVQKITTDADNNIYVTGDYKGQLDFGNGVTITNSTYNCFLAKYNSNGVAQWALGSTINVYHFSYGLQTDNANNVYLGFNFNGTTAFQGSTATLTTNKYDIGIAKFSSTGSFIKATQFGDPLVNEDFLDLGIDSSNNVYLLGYSTTNISFGTKQLAGKGQLILKLDSALTPIKGIKTDLHYSNAGQIPSNMNEGSIAVNADGRFAVSSKLYDSVNYGNNIWLKTQWPNPPQNSGITTLAIVFYDSTITPLWAQRNDTLSPPAYPEVLDARLIIKNDFIYAYGKTGGNTRFNGKTLLNAGQYILKLDFYGNALTGLTQPYFSSAFITSAHVDYDGDIYLTGVFQNFASILNKTKNGFGSYDFFAAKIDDNDITRGYVRSGPYCAGDTITIPFTKNGKFTIGNQFIAELSDSAGNFSGSEVELGRITDTASGTIKGILPFVNISTANKYRIRITSTQPWAQSFYKRDTLKLLIYSKDTANAGADRTVCKGEAIHLSTTGGSKWQWSPTQYFTNPADSNNRQPEIKLYDSVEFRIIISDSSGCGVTDTDYVKIYVRPDIKTTILGDSVVCRGVWQTLTAKPTGGDSTHYWYIWKNAAFGITLGTTPQLTVRPVSTTKYMLLVGDSCSSRVDTTYFTIKPENNLSVSATPDTSICIGRSVKLGAMGVGCNPNKYTYNWYAGSTHLANTDSITVSPTATTTYSIILKDTSTLLVDTAWVTVTPLAPLALSLNADTTICTGQNTLLRATPTGGYTKNHHLQWYANNQPLSTQPQLPISPTATTIYKAILTDGGCSLANDSAEVTITIRPPLSLTLSADTTICIGQNATLSATPAGGWPAGYSIQWLANGTPVDTNYTLTISPAITTTYTAILNDGCTTLGDSGTIQITVRPALAITTTADTTICVAQNVLLRATPTGGLPAGYSIQWWANNTLADTTPTITVSPNQTTTYKAVLKDGCTSKGDSSQTQITVRHPLAVTATAKDSICANQIILLTAAATGGHAANHNLQWYTASTNWSAATNPATDTPKVNTQYIVRLADNCSPDVFDTLNITVLPIPKANAGIAPTFGCPPLNVTLQDFSTGNDTLLNSWNIGTVEYKGNANLSHLLTTPGTYPVRLAVANALGCSDVWVLNGGITVFPKPKADFIIKPDIKEVEEPLHLLNYSKNANNVIWNMGNGTTLYPQGTGDTTYTYTDKGWMNIALIAQNHLGCYDTAIGRILVYDKIHCSIPSAFTPNGDEHNNTFAPVCVGVATYTLTIYNRWGQVIFTQENGIWDGTYYGTPVPAGVYMYKLHIQADSHKKRLTYGTIQVIK